MSAPTESDPIRAVDLFCGAGGLSWGLVEALKHVAIEADEPTEDVLAEMVDLVGVNHWETAIQTHEENHPWARHFHDDVQNVKPTQIFDEHDPEVNILSGGIECVHWSNARGGEPVDEQKRMAAWDVITWIQKLQPNIILFENVPEFEKWGPLDEDGERTRNGETFQAWINAIHSHGYSVDWRVLNAADYGDATSRKRLFIVGRREGTPEFPEPTHSEDGAGDTEEWRTAADIIDWSDRGGSIWTRDLEHPRVHNPLKNSTMERIAEGIRRHCDDRLEPFADALESITRDDVRRLRQNPVPAAYADIAAQALDEPFLVKTTAREQALTDGDGGRRLVMGQHSNAIARDVSDRPAPTVTTSGNIHLLEPNPYLVKYYGTSTARPISAPVDTITSTGNHHALAQPQAYCLRQHSGGTPPSVDDPLPTVAAKGAISKVEPQPMVMPRNGPQRGLHSNPLYKAGDKPLHTVTAKNSDGYVVRPSLIRYSFGGASLDVDDPMPTIATEKGGVFALSNPELTPLTGPGHRTLRPFIDDYEGPAASVDDPIGTITSRDRFALVVPEQHPWGLDVRYRMLQPRELAAAQGFPDDYDFAGTKTDTTEQIGNAVPVNLAQSLVESLLADQMPALTDFIDDDPARVGDEPTPTADQTGTSGGAPADD